MIWGKREVRVLLKIPRGDIDGVGEVINAWGLMYITKTEKAESEAQRGKPRGTLESESRNAIL